MSDFEHLKKQFGTDPKPPADFPYLLAYCDQCERETPTKILFMKAGLGNACASCGRLRRGKPYLSKVEFKTLKPNLSAKGGEHEAESL